jgi:hypothetical protein
MQDNDYQKQLDEEIQAFVVKKNARGFASSQAVIYQTPLTQIYAHCLHIPNNEGEIVKFNLTLLKFKRTKINTPFKFSEGYDSEKADVVGPLNQMHIDLHSKSGGDAVRNLAIFLNSQFEIIGHKIENHKLLVDSPKELDIEDIVKRLGELNISQIESVIFRSKLELLKEYKIFLQNALQENEKFVQNWLDEDMGKYRKQRCLIFGLEYVDHKREGAVQNKRFDILTRASENENEYTLIELKSPNADVFEIEEKETGNEGKTVSYSISKHLARAIPQILQYRRRFESSLKDNEELQRIGVEAGTIGKCIIVIGKRKDDPVWQSHFDQLRRGLAGGLEILTYTDLINKLTLTIKNLEA